MTDKRRLLELLEAKKAIQQEELRTTVPTLIQKAALCSKAKVILVSGGNQSGKSHVGGMRTAICSTGIVPEAIKDEFPQELIRHGNYWCSALDFGGTRDIIKDKLDNLIPERLRVRYSKDDKIYELKSPLGLIGLKSQESGREKYQGVQRLGVWADEEHKKDVFTEIYERTVRLEGWIFFTFSPIEGLTWSHDELFKKAHKVYSTTNTHGIKEELGIVHTVEEIEKMRDRKLLCETRSGEDIDPTIEVFIISKYDNPYLPAKEIQNSERKYKNDPANYSARVLGRYAKVSNNCAFDVARLLSIQAQLPKTYQVGRIEKRVFRQVRNGELKIFKEKKDPGTGWYVIGADVASGSDEGDYSCAQVIDHKTCEQVAVWHGRISPEKFADILILLGQYYNQAYLAPEINGPGLGVVSRIRDQKYRRLYSEYSIPNQVLSSSGKAGKKSYGWRTDAKTRPLMVQHLAEFVSRGHVKINDPDTLDEMFTFVYDKDNKAVALRGCYDDRVVALSIALQIFQRRAIPVMNQPGRNSKPEYKGDSPFGYPI